LSQRVSPFSRLARLRRFQYFFADVPKAASILEIGCGDMWLRGLLSPHHWTNYTGLDLQGPADVVGDIRHWRDLGLREKSFDVIVAFEVIEHVDCFTDLHELLKDNGMLFVTTPVPHMDWLCKLLEWCGINQRRTSPHTRLVYLDRLDLFEPGELRRVMLISQWAKLRKRKGCASRGSAA